MATWDAFPEVEEDTKASSWDAFPVVDDDVVSQSTDEGFTPGVPFYDPKRILPEGIREFAKQNGSGALVPGEQKYIEDTEVGDGVTQEMIDQYAKDDPSMTRAFELSKPESKFKTQDELVAAFNAQDTGQGRVSSDVASGARGVGSIASGIVGGAGSLMQINPVTETAIAAKGLGIPGAETIEDLARAPGVFLEKTVAPKIESAIESVTPVNPIYQNTVDAKISGALGQATGQLGLVLGTGGVGLAPEAATLISLGTAGLQGAYGGSQQAEEMGITGPKKDVMSLLAGALAIGTERMTGVGNKGFTKQLLDEGATALAGGALKKEVAKTILGEGLEEGVEGIGNDIVARVLSEEDPDNKGFTKTGIKIPSSEIDPTSIDFWAKRGEEAALGMVGGGLFGGYQAMTHNNRAKLLDFRAGTQKHLGDLTSQENLTPEQKKDVANLIALDAAAGTQLELDGIVGARELGKSILDNDEKIANSVQALVDAEPTPEGKQRIIDQHVNDINNVEKLMTDFEAFDQATKDGDTESAAQIMESIRSNPAHDALNAYSKANQEKAINITLEEVSKTPEQVQNETSIAQEESKKAEVAHIQLQTAQVASESDSPMTAAILEQKAVETLKSPNEEAIRIEEETQKALEKQQEENQNETVAGIEETPDNEVVKTETSDKAAGNETNVSQQLAGRETVTPQEEPQNENKTSTETAQAIDPQGRGLEQQAPREVSPTNLQEPAGLPADAGIEIGMETPSAPAPISIDEKRTKQRGERVRKKNAPQESSEVSPESGAEQVGSEQGPTGDQEVVEPPLKSGYTRLYRAEVAERGNKTRPNWMEGQPETVSSDAAANRWFYEKRKDAESFAKDFVSEAGDKSKITYVDVPSESVDSYSVKNNKEAKRFSAEGRHDEELFIPREVADTRNNLVDSTSKSFNKSVRDYVQTLPPKAQERWTPEVLSQIEEYHRTGDKSALDTLTAPQRGAAMRLSEEFNPEFLKASKEAERFARLQAIEDEKFNKETTEPSKLAEDKIQFSKADELESEKKIKSMGVPAVTANRAVTALQKTIGFKPGDVVALSKEEVRNNTIGLSDADAIYVILGKVQAFYYRGKSYILPEYIEVYEGYTPYEAVASKILHEHVIHQGIDFVKKSHPDLYRKWLNLSNQIPDSELEKLIGRGYSEYSDYKTNPESYDSIAQEWLAEKFEKIGLKQLNIDDGTLTGKFMGWLKDLFQRVIGIRDSSLSKTQMDRAIQELASNFIAKIKSESRQSTDRPRFSKTTYDPKIASAVATAQRVVEKTPVEKLRKVGAAWREIGNNPKAHRLSKELTSKDMSELFKQLKTSKDVKITEESDPSRPDIAWKVESPRGRSFIYKRGDKVNVDTSEANGKGSYYNPENRGKAGESTLAYQAAQAYANNNGLKFTPDYSGVSPIAQFRRWGQMLSAAVRFNNTEFLDPRNQYGVEEVKQWTDGKDVESDLGALALSEMEYVKKVIPEFSMLTINVENGNLIDNEGDTIGNIASGTLEDIIRGGDYASNFGIGPTTLRRALITKSAATGNTSKQLGFDADLLHDDVGAVSKGDTVRTGSDSNVPTGREALGQVGVLYSKTQAKDESKEILKRNKDKRKKNREDFKLLTDYVVNDLAVKTGLNQKGQIPLTKENTDRIVDLANRLESDESFADSYMSEFKKANPGIRHTSLVGSLKEQIGNYGIKLVSSVRKTVPGSTAHKSEMAKLNNGIRLMNAGSDNYIDLGGDLTASTAGRALAMIAHSGRMGAMLRMLGINQASMQDQLSKGKLGKDYEKLEEARDKAVEDSGDRLVDEFSKTSLGQQLLLAIGATRTASGQAQAQENIEKTWDQEALDVLQGQDRKNLSELFDILKNNIRAHKRLAELKARQSGAQFAASRATSEDEIDQMSISELEEYIKKSEGAIAGAINKFNKTSKVNGEKTPTNQKEAQDLLKRLEAVKAEKPETPKPVRDAFREQVKSGRLFDDFSKKMSDLGVNPETTKSLFDKAQSIKEKNDEATVSRDAIIQKRDQERAADKEKKESEKQRLSEIRKLADSLNKQQAEFEKKSKAEDKKRIEEIKSEVKRLNDEEAKIVKDRIADDRKMKALELKAARKLADDLNKKDKAYQEELDRPTKEAESIISKIDEQHTEWKSKDPDKASAVQQIKKVALLDESTNKDRPGHLDRERFMEAYSRQLTDAGVSKTAAWTLSDRLYRENQKLQANAVVKAREKAFESSQFLKSIFNQWQEATLQQRSNPEFRKQIAVDAFMVAGFTEEKATQAATAFESYMDKKITEVQNKALVEAGRVLNLEHPSLEKLAKAYRAGVFDSTDPVARIMLEGAGMTPLSNEDIQKLAVIDEQLQNTSNQTLIAKYQEQMREIFMRTKPPASVGKILTQAWVSSVLSGARTMALNYINPVNNIVRNMGRDMVGVMTDSVTGKMPKGQSLGMISNIFEVNIDSLTKSLAALKNALKTDTATHVDIAILLKEGTSLKRDNQDSVKKFKSAIDAGNYAVAAKELAKVVWTSTDYVRRLLSSADEMYASVNFNNSLYIQGARALSTIAKYDKSEIDNVLDIARREGEERARTIIEENKVTDSDQQKLILQDESQMAFLEGVKIAVEGETGESSDIDKEIFETADLETSVDSGNRGMEEAPGWDVVNNALNVAIKMSQAARSNGHELLGRILTGFVTVPANIFNRSAYYTPYGLLRTYSQERSKSKDKGEKFYQETMKTDQQIRLRKLEGYMGTIGAAIIAALMSGWKDDEGNPVVSVTGQGSTDKAAAEAEKKGGFQPNSLMIKVGDKMVAVRVSEGLNIPVSILSAIDDMRRNGKAKDKMTPEWAGEFLFTAIRNLGRQASFMSPKSIVSQTIAQGANGRSIGSSAAGIATNFIPFSGLIRSMDKIINGPKDQSSMKAALIANTPIAGTLAGNEALNFLGDNVNLTPENMVEMMSDRFYQNGIPVFLGSTKSKKHDDIYSFIRDTGITPTIPNRGAIEKQYGYFTEDGWKTYIQTRGAILADQLTDNIDSMREMDEAKAESKMRSIDAKATEQAKAELGMEKLPVK